MVSRTRKSPSAYASARRVAGPLSGRSEQQRRPPYSGGHVSFSLGAVIKLLLATGAGLALLGLTNVLGVVARLADEVWTSPQKWMSILIILAGIWLSRRVLPVFFILLSLVALCLTGAIRPLQHYFHGVNGLTKTPLVSRFYCSGQAAPGTSHVYQVNHQVTGVQTLLLVGKSYTGKAVICGATPEYFPVFSLAALESHEQLDLTEEGNLEKVIKDSAAMITQSRGHITFMFIPSLKGTTFRLPFVVKNREILLMPGDFRTTGLSVTRLF